jgi:phosphoribosylformimino-5-aminoimidazole carboxamide ribotide isomerase
MLIIPTIYIWNKESVAVYKGDISQIERYRRTPIEFAKKFAREGAKQIYIVDLNSSRNPDPSDNMHDINKKLIAEIKQEIDPKCELILGGGLRDENEIKMLFSTGIDKVVLGVSAEAIYSKSIKEYGADKIIVGVQAKGDEVKTDKETEFPLRVIDFAEKLASFGVTQILYKDIFKEGTQVHPNYDEVDRLLNMTSLKVYASGGISKITHLELLNKIGVYAAVIGKAFYENELSLSECVNRYNN